MEDNTHVKKWSTKPLLVFVQASIMFALYSL